MNRYRLDIAVNRLPGRPGIEFDAADHTAAVDRAVQLLVENHADPTDNHEVWALHPGTESFLAFVVMPGVQSPPIDRAAVEEAVDRLKADEVELTWKIQRLAAPGGGRTDEHLFVHVAHSPYGGLQTSAAILGALLPVCTQVHITSSDR